MNDLIGMLIVKSVNSGIKELKGIKGKLLGCIYKEVVREVGVNEEGGVDSDKFFKEMKRVIEDEIMVGVSKEEYNEFCEFVEWYFEYDEFKVERYCW